MHSDQKVHHEESQLIYIILPQEKHRNFTDAINNQNTVRYFTKCTHMHIYLLST